MAAEKQSPAPAKDESPASYREAAQEIEDILQAVEGEAEIDVDQLADRVERASHLIQFCLDRLQAAELRVRKVNERLQEAAERGAGEATASGE